MKNREKLVQFEDNVTDEPIDDVVMVFFPADSWLCIFRIWQDVRIKGTQDNPQSKANIWFDEECYNAKRLFKKDRNTFNRNKSDYNGEEYVRTRTMYNKI